MSERTSGTERIPKWVGGVILLLVGLVAGGGTGTALGRHTDAGVQQEQASLVFRVQRLEATVDSLQPMVAELRTQNAVMKQTSEDLREAVADLRAALASMLPPARPQSFSRR